MADTTVTWTMIGFVYFKSSVDVSQYRDMPLTYAQV